MTAFDRATPVLKTADYPRAKAFYGGPLGFDLVEEGGTPPRFGIFKRGSAVVFVDSWHGAPAAVGEAWDAYFHVADVDDLAADLRAAGVELAREPTDRIYGMRECEVLDPDGNRLCFGQDV